MVSGQVIDRLPQGPVWSTSGSGDDDNDLDCFEENTESLVMETTPILHEKIIGKERKNSEASKLSTFSPIELLTVLFGEHEKHVLQLALEACEGHILKAIEHFANIRRMESAPTVTLFQADMSRMFQSFISPKSYKTFPKQSFLIDSLLEVCVTKILNSFWKRVELQVKTL